MTANTAHEIFRQPADPNVKVWRYMDFTKYVSLLETSALWFNRVDQLGDPFEASWTVASDRVFDTMFQTGPLTADAIAMFRAHYAENRKTFRASTYVTCWHWGNHESAAMWQLYGKTNEAIAIQTTYAKLAGVMPDADEVLIGLVEYVDYDEVSFGMTIILSPATRKRLSFEHEREVRALKLLFVDPQPLGIPMKVDLAALISRVYVAPNSPAWYDILVRRVTQRLGWNFDIAPSRLSERPIY